MHKRNNRYYADAFKYLHNERMNAVALMVVNPEGWVEKDMPINLSVQVEEKRDENGKVVGYDAYFMRRLFLIQLESVDYGAVKSTVVQRRYSMDDQMAIILNKDKSEEKMKEYEDMQEWRNFAATIAQEVQYAIEDEKRLLKNK